MKISKGKKVLKNNLKSKFSFQNTGKLLILTTLLVVFLACVSSVSAVDFNNDADTGKNIQDFINNPNNGNEIVLNSGDYINNIKNLKINRSVIIKGNGQVNLIGSSSDTLFNISARNVIISNLNISGYKTAVFSNTGDLLVKNCNISTTGCSIDFKGSTLTNITIENNDLISSYSSYSYGVINVNGEKYSKVSISIKGNNITNTGTGTYTMNIRLNVPYCDNTLILENNKIIGKDYEAIYINSSNSTNTIIFTNNDISLEGKGSLIQERAIYMNLVSSNNTIDFSGNNITARLAYGVFIEANYAPSNTITFTKNKITINAPTITRTAVYILSRYDGITNITFKDNNVTAASNMAVNFDLTLRTNIITFINNKITQEENTDKPYGLYILSTKSNNTITITNNNITGLWRSFALYIIDCTNNNIIVNKNNIEGITFGLQLTLSGVNKDIIHIVENNITGNEFAINVVCPVTFSTVSGLSISNNVLKGNNGLNFDVNRVSLKNINITGNTIIVNDTGITFSNINNKTDSTAAINVNYNRILADIGLNFRYVSDTGSSFDYNWWGVNDIDNKIIGFETKNHYILYFANLTDLTNAHVGDKVIFALLVVNTTLKNTGVENLPYFVINGTFNGVEFETSLDNLFTYEFIVLEEGLHYLEATLDDQYANVSFEGLKAEENETPDTEFITKKGKDKNSKTKKGKNIDPSKYDISNTEEVDDYIKNSSSNVLRSYAGMKSSGVPIAILLILAIFGLAAYRRK